jgi:hypothetical protein
MAEEAPPSKPGGDWTVEVVHRIDTVVGTVRDKTTVPITKVARIVVYGLIAAVAAIIALWLSIVAVVRLAVVYLPFHPLSRRVWVVELALGAIFLAVGAFIWRKRWPAND